MLRPLLACALLAAAVPAQSEIPIPQRFGDWNLVCYHTDDAAAWCSVSLRTEGMPNYRDRVGSSGLSLSVDILGANRYEVTTFGSSAATCGRVTIREDLALPRRPQSERYYDEFVVRLQRRVSETIQTHLALLGHCSPMGEPKGAYPADLFEASIPDLNAAIAVMAEKVRQARPKAHRPLRPS